MTNYNRERIQKVFNQADNYFVFVDGMNYKKGYTSYLNPYYVNCLFCCELYLKTLLMIENIEFKFIKKAKHDLKELFYLINDDSVQMKLLEELDKRLEGVIDSKRFLETSHDDFTAIRYMYINNDKEKERQLNKNFPCCIMFMYVLRDYLDLIINGRDTYKEVTKSVSI